MAAIVAVLYLVYYVKLIPILFFIAMSIVTMIVLTYLERAEFEDKLEEYDEFYVDPDTYYDEDDE